MVSVMIPFCFQLTERQHEEINHCVLQWRA